MIEKSEQKRPAAEAVGPIIAEAVGELTDHEKKLVGRLIKQAIAPHGWQPWKQKRLPKNHFFIIGERRSVGVWSQSVGKGAAACGEIAAARA
jgi:hypothetical protein